MAKIAELRARVGLTAPTEALTRNRIEVALEGAVSAAMHDKPCRDHRA